jgi:hypothetical protein
VPLPGVSPALVVASSDRKSDGSGESSYTVGDEVCNLAVRSTGFAFTMLASTRDPLDTDCPAISRFRLRLDNLTMAKASGTI